ncbi:hypothetical protein V6N13_134366 [Hibiscus sabdariffa]
MVNSPRFCYTGDKTTFFDMCHVDSMSMLEMYDIVDELGVFGKYTLYWKHPGGSLNVKHLRTDSDILLMLNSLPRNRQLHVFLEEDVEPITRTDSDIRSKGVEPVTIETHIRTEVVEPITRTDIRTESEDDSEDSDYVAVDSSDGDSGFEESEIDMSDEEGFAHDVHVEIHTEMDCTNLNSDLLGSLPAMTLDDENVGDDDLHSASESDSDGEFTKNRKPRCPEFHNESDSLNPQFGKGMIFGDKDTLKQCLRAKHLALEMVLGSHKEQYSMIYDYLGEIRQTNPGITTILMLDERVFLRMYICLQAYKDGYKARCRSVLSIDDCHLKGYYGGTFLADVVVDANDNIYPLAYAVVEGLVEAISEVFPCAEHRTCVRHLYSNFKNRENFKGKNLKDALWKAARAIYVKEFEDAMAELKALSVPAFDWLKGKDPAQWSRSHFSPRSKCDMLLSNLSECFNKMILDARDKPILTLMEMVRTKMMKKIAMKKEQAEKWTEILCPKIQQKVESAIQQCTRCWPTHAGGQKYQISAGPLNQHAVNMEHHTYSCRKWDITVIEPKLRRPPGRPKKQRVKEADEAQNKSGPKWTKKGLVMYCSKCKQPGHNQRTCKGVVGANRPVRPPRVASVKPPLRTPKLQVRRATDNMPTSSSPAVCATSSSAADVSATTSSSPFVSIPTPGYGMTVKMMPSSQEDNTGSQHLSQSSTVIQTSQEDNSLCTMAKKPRMV